MINWLSNPINRNRSAAKISKVMSSTADKIHVIGVQKTVNPEFRGTPNCLSLALVKSLSVNERVTDITTIGLVLVWCPVLPGVHHFGFYKLIMLLLFLLLVQNMAFVSDCNMVRCNWWTYRVTRYWTLQHGQNKTFSIIFYWQLRFWLKKATCSI